MSKWKSKQPLYQHLHSTKMATHNDLGKAGEKFAIDYLQNNGYQILEKNWRYLKAEVDIIALKDNTLSVIEVKTRSSDYFGAPEDFVNQKKIDLLITAIDEYVTRRNLPYEVRFDIISLLKKDNSFDLEHIEDAFSDF